jgi:hypothetical protein
MLVSRVDGVRVGLRAYFGQHLSRYGCSPSWPYIPSGCLDVSVQQESGDLTVECQDRGLHLSRGQCCVVPVGAEHRAMSKADTEAILFQQATGADAAAV